MVTVTQNEIPLVEEYHRSGPVFRIKAFGMNFIILAGAEVNKFMQKQGTEYFNTAEVWEALKEELGADKLILSSDGEEHFEMRRIMKREDYFTDLRYFIRKLINIVTGRQPKFSTKFPKYKRAKARSFELSRKVIEEHRNKKSEVPDYIDDLLAANKDNEPFFSERDLLCAAMSPFIAGLDTLANTAAFQLYDLLKNPDVLETVRNEVDDAFADGIPDLKKLRQIKSLHALALESLRIHPVAPVLKRVAKKTFEYNGYTIKKDEHVMIPMVLTHFLPEFFPDPYKFDINRYSPERNEHRQASIYAPFGLGTHICSGNKFSEVLLMAIAATMIHYFEFEPLPQSYEVKLDTNPLPGPSRKFSFKIKDVRAVLA